MRSYISYPYIIGLPVVGPDFFGREDQKRQFFSMLNSQTLQPMRVMGLRRSGKTSFLRHVSNCNEERNLLNRKDQRTVITYVDLQYDIKSINDFCEAVIKAIHKKIPHECMLPAEIKGFKTLSHWLENTINKNLRCVVLLDEYEVLTDASCQEFDVSFFQHLRAICCNELLSFFTWTICSNFELSDNSIQQRRHDRSSPFENIFQLKPIIMGGLRQDELCELINRPIEKENVIFTPDEISTIEEIAGSLPLIVKAVAQEWFLIKKNKESTFNLFEKILDALLYPNSDIDRLFRNYWKRFSKNECGCLSKIFRDTSNKRSYTHIEKKLIDYGLIKTNRESVIFSSELFKKWLLDNNNNIDNNEDKELIEGVSSMIQTDINRLIMRIEEYKESINDLESRITNLKAARAKLNKTTQIIEFDQYTDQITEIKTTIDDLKDELYGKRNQLLSLTFGDNNLPEVTTEINDRLHHLSAEHVNTLFFHVVELQTAMESAGIPMPHGLKEVKEIAESKTSSDEEKRTKLKLTINLLGLKLEIEKMIADVNVRNALRNFWMKAKKIALKEDN